jgi:hypothetical protein
MRNALVFLGTLTIVLIFWPYRLFSHELVTTTVTYDREISQILKKKCIMCHSENNLGMPFTSYEQTRPWSRAIEDEVLVRHMPPWRAVQGYNQFTNDLSLTNRERQFMVSWAEGNGPKSKNQESVLNFDEETPLNERLKFDSKRWRLGKPDLAKTLPGNLIAPGGVEEVRRVTIDLGLGSERSVRALDFFLKETGQWLGSWTAWYGVTTLPPDTAYQVPAGSHVIVELHYKGTAEAVEDRSTLGLYFAQKPAAHRPSDLVLESKAEATSSVDAQRFAGSVRMLADAKILALRPELTPGIESVEVTARKPDGTVEVLLLIKDALPEWPTPYILSQPVALPKYTQLDVSAYYARSSGKRLPASFLLTVRLNDAAEIGSDADRGSATVGHR